MKNFSGIHPTALIGDGVTIGQDVTIGPRTIIYDNVKIGDKSQIGADVILGEPVADIYRNSEGYANPALTIGNSSVIRSGSILYAGSTFGDRLETGHRVTIREGTIAGTNFRVGTLSDIQGDCRIGDYVRFHSNVHIGQKSTVGNYVWIFPYVVLTNDPHPPSETIVGVTVEDFAVIATMSVVLPGVIVGELRTPPNPSPMAPPPANGRFYTRDGAAMARALGVEGPLRPEVVFAVSTANPETPTLRPSAPPPAFSNNHLGYALTWFGLAVALVGFYAALLRRRLKKDLS